MAFPPNHCALQLTDFNWQLLVHEDDHSGFMLAARITLLHFSVSAAMSFAKSPGEPGKTVPPSSVSRALVLGSVRLTLISTLSMSIIAAGVFFGAPTPNH